MKNSLRKPRKAARFLPFACGLLLCASAARADGWDYPGWHDDAATRVKALALLQSVNATLLSQPSATRTLQQWCEAHQLAAEPRIRALRDTAIRKPADAEARSQLKVGADEAIGYRRVQLACGDHVLSEADNWYVPSRLTPEMNHLLDTTDTPFGTAVRALNFTRRTESARLLWSPLPQGWETRPLPAAMGQSGLDIPERVLQHRAVLYKDGGTPFSLVVETYRRDLFAFPLNPPAAGN
jgi:chorismate-pyruvate lyase